MKYVYRVEPGDVYWAVTDAGWVVGHSYMIYGPLLQGYTPFPQPSMTQSFQGKLKKPFGWLTRIKTSNSGAKGVVDTPEDECSSDNLLNKDFLSHP
jgi:hypothetical protein